jgi:hypothetical protein
MEVQNQNISTKDDSSNNLSRATFGAASASFLGNTFFIGARVPDAIERGAYVEATGLTAGVTVAAVASTVFLVRAIKARKG